MRAVLVALEDYAMDKRGDVGSWVREAALRLGADLLWLAAATGKTVVAEPAPDAEAVRHSPSPLANSRGTCVRES
jgi:hypothetical protein